MHDRTSMPSRPVPNPLSEMYGADPSDSGWVCSANKGDRTALDKLIRRHQPWIYNLALRMLWDARDAEDATQEILIRIVTALSSFRGESAFRTWAYRVATNHLLTRKRGRVEQIIGSFECYGRALDETPDDASADPSVHDPELQILIEESKVGCTTGMLLCLDREQRLVFVLGEVFDVSDSIGAEVLEMSRESFRQRLSRARRQLYGFMQGKCGLANPANACRCARKTRGFIREGVDPKRLQLTGPALSRVAEVAPRVSHLLDAWAQAGYGEIFRNQPFQAGPDLASSLRALIEDHGVRALLGTDVT